MGEVHAPANVESVVIDAVVFRRDGTVEDLGTIAEYHRSGKKKDRWESLKNLASHVGWKANGGSYIMADNGQAPVSTSGQYRIQLDFGDGPAHWGRVYNSAEEAQAEVQAAKTANPDAKSVSVVALVDSSTGKTAKWEAVD